MAQADTVQAALLGGVVLGQAYGLLPGGLELLESFIPGGKKTGVARQEIASRGRLHVDHAREHALSLGHHLEGVLVLLLGLLEPGLAAHGDRKSTRLNSSHSQISYAVFCLKKKKK